MASGSPWLKARECPGPGARSSPGTAARFRSSTRFVGSTARSSGKRTRPPPRPSSPTPWASSAWAARMAGPAMASRTPRASSTSARRRARLPAPGEDGASITRDRRPPRARSPPRPPPGAWGVGSIHQLAWRTDDEEHQLKVRAQVETAGGNATPVIDRFWFKSVYFREPGGVLFELATDGPGFSIDEDPGHLGGARMPPPPPDPPPARPRRPPRPPPAPPPPGPGTTPPKP